MVAPHREEAITRTQHRRLQRRHTQLSYAAARSHLVALLRLLPVGIISTELETFRHSLYSQPIADIKAERMQPAQPPMCSWCGVWTPLPETNTAVQASFRPRIARARRIYIPTQIKQYPEHVPAQERCVAEIVPSISVEACNILSMDDLLQPTRE